MVVLRELFQTQEVMVSSTFMHSEEAVALDEADVCALLGGTGTGGRQRCAFCFLRVSDGRSAVAGSSYCSSGCRDAAASSGGVFHNSRRRRHISSRYCANRPSAQYNSSVRR